MEIVLLTTMADSRRPGLVYRIEFEGKGFLDAWLDHKIWLEEKHRVWMLNDDNKRDGINTVATIFRSNGTTEVKEGGFRWDQIITLLEFADGMDREVIRSGSGRIPKRCLISTTSKERREGGKAAY